VAPVGHGGVDELVETPVGQGRVEPRGTFDSAVPERVELARSGTIVAILLKPNRRPQPRAQAMTSTRATSARASSTSVRPNAAGSNCWGDSRPSHSSMSSRSS
jgi:hypothetical protein